MTDFNDPIEKEEMRRALNAAISKLPERRREVIRLHFVEGMTLREIANLKGLSWERIKQINHNALSILRHPSNAKELRQFLR